MLERDGFARLMGVRLMEASAERVLVEMDVDPALHLDSSGRVSAGVLFSLADCAMSLISNAETTAVAIATHFVGADHGESVDFLTADIRPRLPVGGRSTTWEATLAADGEALAVFTGTTLAVGGV